MLTLLLLACSTSNSPIEGPTAAEHALAAIERIQGASAEIEATSGAIAQAASQALEAPVPSKEAVTLFKKELKTLQDSTANLQNILGEAGQALAIPQAQR